VARAQRAECRKREQDIPERARKDQCDAFN